MAVLVDTVEVAPKERFDFWSASSCWIFHPLRLRQPDDRPFDGRISAHQLGSTTAFRIQGDPSIVTRTRQTIAELDPEIFDFGLQARGRCRVEQGHRRTVTTAGDISSWESSHPWTVEAKTPFELQMFMVPRVLLEPHAERIYAQTARRLPRGEGFGSVVAPFISGLFDALDRGSVRPSASIGDCVVDLIRSIYLERVDPDGAARRRSPAELLLRVKSYIEAHLGDPDLDPERIARASFISPRYLYKLFEAEQTGVCEWIRWQRLERCRRDLLDPALAHETILSIATRWGLPNPAHFSRLFRAAYGCSPRELRARPHDVNGAATRPPFEGVLPDHAGILSIARELREGQATPGRPAPH